MLILYCFTSLTDGPRNTPKIETGYVVLKGEEFTISINILANPLTDFTRRNMTFTPVNSALLSSLPIDVSTTISGNQPNVLILIYIRTITEDHYGTYSLRVQNQYGEYNATFDLHKKGK